MNAHLLTGRSNTPFSADGGKCRPAIIVDVEMSLPVTAINSEDENGARSSAVWLLVRIFSEPVGLIPIQFPGPALSVRHIVEAVDANCGPVVRARLEHAGCDVAAAMAGQGSTTDRTPGFLSRHITIAAEGPEITVAICTRNRPHDLGRAIASLANQSYQRFSVLVVDNAPSDDQTEKLIRSLVEADDRLSYALEPRPGLSWARNHALDLIESPVVAWLDDDEVADEHWLMEIAGAFLEDPGTVAVSGSVIPAELKTESQMWFEQFGGHSKGRGFSPDIFGRPGDTRQSPLYPLPPFGVGANMAFDVETLRELGGFDTALGAGTTTLGGEDTLVFTQILLRGGRIAYRPSALTRHFHRPDYPSLARQMRGYGVGLTAYYVALLRSNWRLILPLLRLVPSALKDTFGRTGAGLAGVPDSFPRELLRVKTRGMLAGPLAYYRARRLARAMRGGGR